MDASDRSTLLSQYCNIQIDGRSLQPIEEEALLVDGNTQINTGGYSNRVIHSRRPNCCILIIVVIVSLLFLLLCLLLAGCGIVIYMYVFDHKPGSIAPSNVTNVTITTTSFTSHIGANTTVFVSEELFDSTNTINFTILSKGQFPQMISFYMVPSNMISYTSVDLVAPICQFSSGQRGSVSYNDPSCLVSHYSHHPIYTAGNGSLQFHLTLTPSIIDGANNVSCYFQLYVFDDKNSYMDYIDNSVVQPPHIGSICLKRSDFFRLTLTNVTLRKNKFYYVAYSLMDNMELSGAVGGHVMHINQNGMYTTECTFMSTTDRCVVDVSSYHSDNPLFFLLAHTENTSEEDINVTVFTKSHV